MKPIYLEKSIGIDIRSDSVAMVLIGKKLTQTDLLGACWFRIRDIDGPDKKEEQVFLTEANRFLMHHNAWPQATAISLPRRLFTFETFELPAPDAKSVPAMIEFEMERHFASMEHCYADHLYVQRGASQFHISAAAIRSEKADYYFELMDKLSLPPASANLSTIANASLALSRPGARDEISAIVDIDAKSIETVIMKNGGIEASRHIPLNDPDIQKAYANDALSSSHFEALSQGLAKLVIEGLQNALGQCRNIQESESIERIWLCGGGELANSLAYALEKTSGVQVEALGKLNGMRDWTRGEFDPAYHTTALGLAVAELNSGNNRGNLLPVEKRPKKKRGNLKVTAGMAAGVILLIAGLWVNQTLYNKQTLANLDRQLQEIKTQAGAFEKIDLAFETLERSTHTLNAIEADHPARLAALLELSNIVPGDSWLTTVKFTKNEMEVKGYSSSASKLIPIIENSPLFRDASFTGTILSEAAGEKFSIKAQMESVS
ncbi:MAG: hypothetical protein G3M78_12905 [Candidatus Nitrohelix vancouverensis]|uniref:Uncharacterized protein n=1 Tax=Candidatus Nitrohelix vancouverensis TaxID=2705534 RepID=A0A7T0G4C2_9BACT|nr:MAG: hypothetical protein G3M78_12905 [Candidatus Nitrohelix vancouverensis]